MGLDVTVADALRVDVGQRPEKLIDVQLHLQDRHRCLEFVEVTGGTIHCLWNILEHQIEVHFVFLSIEHGSVGTNEMKREETYSVAVGVVERLQLDDIRVSHNPHDLQFTVLLSISFSFSSPLLLPHQIPYLESLVLEDSLDGRVFPAGRHLGLKDHTEGAIADDLTLGVGDLLGLAGQSILDLLADDLLWRG